MTKTALILLILCLSGFSQAQDRFREDYNLFMLCDGPDLLAEEVQQNTFVFNVNESNDILRICPDGSRILYRNMSLEPEIVWIDDAPTRAVWVLNSHGDRVRLYYGGWFILIEGELAQIFFRPQNE